MVSVFNLKMHLGAAFLSLKRERRRLEEESERRRRGGKGRGGRR